MLDFNALVKEGADLWDGVKFGRFLGAGVQVFSTWDTGTGLSSRGTVVGGVPGASSGRAGAALGLCWQRFPQFLALFTARME